MPGDVAPRGAAFICEPLEGRRLLAVQLVADLHPATLGSEPAQFASSGTVAYFGARADFNALWRTDGTPGGTVQVRDNLGRSTYPRHISIIGPKVYFAANDQHQGEEPWVSDGTAGGTVLLKDVMPDSGSSEPGEFTALGDPAAGRAVFYARGSDGWEPYVTDGTTAGTVRLLDINPGPADSLASAFTRFGGQIIFTANDAAGRGVWKTDGTPAGTVKIASGIGGTSYVEFGGALYFQGASPSTPGTYVLWRTDGTPAGTVPVAGPDGPPYGPGTFFERGGALWFIGSDEPEFRTSDWWRTDGTDAGTVKVIDLPPASRISSGPGQLGNGRLVFYCLNSDTGRHEIWSSDGTTAGSSIVKVFEPSPGGFDNGFGFRVFGGRAMFLARDAEHGMDFWMTDGTAGGTVPFELNPGPGSAVGTNISGAKIAAWVGERLVFQGAAESGDTEPFVTDGTAAGTRKLAEINSVPAGSTIARPLVRLGGGIIFDADGKLLFTDGTPGNLVRLADVSLLNPYLSTIAVTAHSSAVVNGVAVFGTINADSTVRRVYRSDGTPGGTYPLGTLDPSPGQTPSNSYWSMFAGGPFVTAGNFVYFFATDGTRGMELWKTDGTIAGTSIVKDLWAGPSGAIPRSPLAPAMAAVGETVYFKAFVGELWKTDGTDAGTVRLKSLGGGGGSNDWLHSFVAAGDRLFFEGYLNYLWVSDGTEAGTREVLSFVEVVSRIVPLGDDVYFWGRDVFTNAVRLYRSDGTAARTVMVGTVLPPSAGPTVGDPMLVHGGALYFAGRDAVGGTELWKTDGTGAVRVKDIRPGTAESRPTHFGSFGGRLYFFADDGTHGRELWSSDGTPEGTRLEQDIYPGPLGSNVITRPFAEPVATDDELFFVAQDDRVGRELWRVTGAPSPAVAGRYLFYNHSAFDGRNPAAGPADDGAVAPDKAALLPGGAATFANVSGYSRGINGVMIDIHYVTADLDADDFEFRVGTGGDPSAWALAPAPLSVTERVPPALAAPTRVTLVWADGAVRNRWLRVTVKANADTHLETPDVFYFGNLVGEAGDGAALAVGSGDLTRTRAAVSAGKAVGAGNAFDHNRDGRVDVLDVAIVRGNLGAALTPVATTPAASGGRVGRRRGAWVDVLLG